MKYIKTYEDIHLANYAICKSDDNTLLCIEIIDADEFRNSAQVQTMTFDRNKEVHKSAKITTRLSVIMNRIVYQSNDIEDIIIKYDLMKTQTKYNL
jgi:hypothetical protein